MTKKIVDEFLAELACEQLALILRKARKVWATSSSRTVPTVRDAARIACSEVPALEPIIVCLMISGMPEIDAFCDRILEKGP